jgi:hypothetical protein
VAHKGEVQAAGFVGVICHGKGSLCVRVGSG